MDIKKGSFKPEKFAKTQNKQLGKLLSERSQLNSIIEKRSPGFMKEIPVLNRVNLKIRTIKSRLENMDRNHGLDSVSIPTGTQLSNY